MSSMRAHLRLISLLTPSAPEPGGYLQWEEVDNVGYKVLKQGKAETPALEKVITQLCTAAE